MQITKKHNNSNRCKTINFIQLISDLELYTGKKQNRVSFLSKIRDILKERF